MRRHFLALTVLTLAMLLTAGLIWAEEAKNCQKSMTGTVVGCEKKCATEKACAKTGEMASVDAGHHSASGEGCHGSIGGLGMDRDVTGCLGTGGHDEKGCGGSEGHHCSGGGHATMAGGGGHCMKAMHRGMTGSGGRSGRHHREKMGAGFSCLGGPGHFVRMAEKLELTEKQVEDLKALRWNHERTAIEMRAQIETAHVDLKQLLGQESLDFGKIKAKVSQIADMHKKMRLARWTLMEKSHDLLTAEQLEKAKTLRKQGPGSMMEGRRQMIRKMIIEEDEE